MAGIFLSGKKNGVGDMTRGPLTRQMIVFAIPLMISGVLQLLFHTADMAVVGRFASYKAMAAVGATGSITHLLVNIFIGLSIGTNVMVARYLGAKSEQDISKTVHTSVLLALAGGVFLVLLGTAIARPILAEMDTPAEILDMSTLYMQIYFCGMPMALLYNFGSAILRAMGDTTRPFYYLVAGGVINIALNLFFVIVCGMDVAGVAIATAVSQGVSAVLILRALMKIDGPCRVYWRKLRFCWKNLREILWVGIPAGFQSSCFSISNILIQSSINSFGSAAVAGNVAFCLLENFSHATLDAFSQTVITFVSCNYGAGQYERLKKTVRTGLIAGCINGIVWAIFLLLAADWLLSCFNSDPEVLSWGMLRSYYIAPGFIIASVMQINTGAMRGLGHSLEPSLISIFSICILRVVWIFTVFRQFPRMEILLISYPLTWLVNALLVTVLLKITMKKCMTGAKAR